MLQFKPFVFSALLFLLFVAGCQSSASIYQPEPLVLHQLTHRNDFSIEAASFGSWDIKGFSGVAAYSPIKHVFVAGHLTQAGAKIAENNNDFFSQGRFLGWGGSIGGYYPIGRRAMAQLSVGHSFHKYTNYFSQTFSTAEFSPQKTHLQLGMTLRSNAFHLGYGLRANFMRYDVGSVEVPTEVGILETAKYLREKPAINNTELGMEVGYTIKEICFKTQISQVISGVSLTGFQVVSFGFGISYSPVAQVQH